MNSKQKRICRLCLKKAGRKFEIVNDSIKGILSVLQLRIDLNVTKTPIICKPCMGSLENCSNFVINCWYVEEKIKEYCKVAGTDSYGQVELSNVQQFISKNKIESARGDNRVNVEVIEVDESSCESVDFEEVVVKDEYEEGSSENVEFEEVEVKSEEEVNMEGSYIDVKQEQIELVLDNSKSNRCNDTLPQLEEERQPLTAKDPLSIIHLCHMCAYTTKNKNNLDHHMLMHIDESEITMYQCEICAYKTKWTNFFKRHMLDHKNTSEGMYKCDMCSLEVKCEYDFKQHALTHSEAVIYQCKECAYKAQDEGTLKQHMVEHDPELKYHCEICNYTTKYKANLKKHLQSHKSSPEIELFECHLCEYKTEIKEALKNHIMLTHKYASTIIVYQCKLCLFEARNETSLIKHLSERHKLEFERGARKCNYYIAKLKCVTSSASGSNP